MYNLAQEILELAEKQGAVLYGQFTLSSGKASDHYWDGKKVTLSARGSYLVGRAIFDMVAGLNIDAIGGLEMGAIPISTAVALVSHLQSKEIPAFIVRQKPKEHGTRVAVEGYLPEGGRVVIVDDVVTTGESTIKAIEVAEARGCDVVGVIALVDRHEGGGDRLKSAGYDFRSILVFQKQGDRTVLRESG